jgi:cytoskeletal protein CcmA (bactofilin family)
MALWKETTMNDQGEKSDTDPVQVSPIPQRTEIAPKSSRESVFGTGVAIEGKIEGESDVRIAGNFKGDIHITGNLSIEKGAHITAKINAASVTIGGEVEGNVHASAQVKLLESGQLIGDLKASTLTVVAGSRMRGHVEFGWTHSEGVKMASMRPQEKDKNGAVV